MRKGIAYFLLLTAIMAGCKDKFTADLPSTQKNLLVVEGNLVPGTGETSSVTLTRTFSMADTGRVRPVLNAMMTVEAKDGSVVGQLPHTSPGSYTGQLNLSLGKEYRLRIRTTDGRTYLSDYVLTKASPPIDSLEWEEYKEGIRIYVNTKDPANNSWYYKWHYEETWAIHSVYNSPYKYVPVMVVMRTPAEMVYECWKSKTSTDLFLGTSSNLTADVINKAPLHAIEKNSERLSVRYSVLVKQTVLSKQAYDYLQIMKRNTENLGSVFDAQPSQLKGNIMCLTNPEEEVIGFLTASTVTEKRIFVSSYEVPWSHFTMSCEERTIANNPTALSAEMPFYIPIYPVENPQTGAILAWQAATPRCVDCTLRGGTLTKPSFW